MYKHTNSKQFYNTIKTLEEGFNKLSTNQQIEVLKLYALLDIVEHVRVIGCDITDLTECITD